MAAGRTGHGPDRLFVHNRPFPRSNQVTDHTPKHHRRILALASIVCALAATSGCASSTGTPTPDPGPTVTIAPPLQSSRAAALVVKQLDGPCPSKAPQSTVSGPALSAAELVAQAGVLRFKGCSGDARAKELAAKLVHTLAQPCAKPGKADTALRLQAQDIGLAGQVSSLSEAACHLNLAHLDLTGKVMALPCPKATKRIMIANAQAYGRHVFATACGTSAAEAGTEEIYAASDPVISDAWLTRDLAAPFKVSRMSGTEWSYDLNHDAAFTLVAYSDGASAIPQTLAVTFDKDGRPALHARD